MPSEKANYEIILLFRCLSLAASKLCRDLIESLFGFSSRRVIRQVINILLLNLVLLETFHEYSAIILNGGQIIECLFGLPVLIVAVDLAEIGHTDYNSNLVISFKVVMLHLFVQSVRYGHFY